MNVNVKLNGSDITSHVIKYDREHKICSGIGVLELEVEYTFPGGFDPWDQIDIYENGDHAARYYVSQTSDSQPGSTISVSCQDNSKRLSDYFIPDSYIIDYPSYSRFWIEYFLDEVGISYDFLTDDPGQLLSNNTSLGLTTAYEQVMMLLQISGWYIKFDANDVAIIGRLDANFGSAGGSYGRHDITEIKVIKSDTMLRNRVVVWGHGDPSTSRWVFADVSKPTKWDYDVNDKRTIVISNSNIPNTSSAFIMANQALTEFARLTIEKHLTVTDARDIQVGDIVRVSTKIFTGKGMVTTFGVSMSSSGLISNIILDERCPRLFGFFDLTGFVYVGTFGSGVWRKHTNPSWSGGSPTGSGLIGFASGIYNPSGWYDYSLGLNDYNVTDLHVNAGILVCVAASGSSYYSLEDEHPWSGIPISGYQVSKSGILLQLADGTYDPMVYSGVMARACIIDRDTNFARIAIDTRSGINYGDFLMETEPLTTRYYEQFSYITPSGTFSPMYSGVNESGFRSWVLDINAYDGSITEAFPIGVSGNYNFLTFDIENDGSNDFVEAMTILSGLMPTNLTNGFYNAEMANFVFNNEFMNDTSTSYGKKDEGTLPNVMSYSGLMTPALQSFPKVKMALPAFEGSFFLEDFTPYGYAYMVTSTKSAIISPKLQLVAKKIFVNPDNSIVTTSYSKTLSDYDYTKVYPVTIIKLGEGLYRYIFRSGEFSSVGEMNPDALICDYDLNLDTVSIIFIPDLFPIILDDGLKDGINASFALSTIVIGTTLYSCHFDKNGPVGTLGFVVYLSTTNLLTLQTSKSTLFTMTGSSTIGYYNPSVYFIPYMDTYILMGVYKEQIKVGSNYGYKIHKFFKQGIYGSLSNIVVFDHQAAYGNFSSSVVFTMIQIIGAQINNARGYFSYGIARGGGGLGTVNFYDYVDHVENTYDGYTLPPIGNFVGNFKTRLTEGIASPSALNFIIINPYDFSTVSTVITPSGYSLLSFEGLDSVNGDMYFRAYNGDLVPSNLEMIATDGNGYLSRRTNLSATGGAFEHVLGNFRICPDGPAWMQPNPILMKYPLYLVLQRSGYDFGVVKSGIYRDRLDISDYSPLVTMDRRVSSTETFFISQDNSVQELTHISMSGYNLGVNQASGSMFFLGITSDDFRYSDFENVVESGTSRELYIVYSGGIGSLDVYSLSAFSGIYQSPSGVIRRIEISNFNLPTQSVFIAVSGVVNVSGEWGFFQKDPEPGTFVDYSSGYPQARTTIVRLDDRL